MYRKGNAAVGDG